MSDRAGFEMYPRGVEIVACQARDAETARLELAAYFGAPLLPLADALGRQERFDRLDDVP